MACSMCRGTDVQHTCDAGECYWQHLQEQEAADTIERLREKLGQQHEELTSLYAQIFELRNPTRHPTNWKGTKMQDYIIHLSVDVDALRKREGYGEAPGTVVITELLEGLFGPEYDPHSGAEISPSVPADVYVF